MLAILSWIRHPDRVQGTSEPNPELLDAAALCGHLVPAGSVHAFLGDHRHQLFPDKLFVDLFPSDRGRPSVPADVIATTMVLQALEGLSDRDAIRQLQTNITWKVATGLSLADEGFHPTVLTLWRNKLRASDAPERIFEAVRAVIDATGVLKGRTRRALDSTVLDDAVATQDTVTQLISAIRRVRRLVPEASSIALLGHDYDDGAKPVIAWDDPAAKEVFITALVNDALALIRALDAVALDTEQSDAIGLLALVAGQDVEPGDTDGTWRIAPRTAPDRVISTVDPESRHVHKTVREYRDGFKAHLAVEPETGLVTATTLTSGNTPDGPTGVELLAGEGTGLDVLADSAYGSGPVRAALREARHRQLIKPIPLRRHIAGGFTRDDFDFDHDAATVSCPSGHTVAITARGYASFERHCKTCPMRARCTTSARGMKLTITEHDRELVLARHAWREGAFANDYRRWRPMVERTIAWLVANGNRRVRYRGVARNQLWLSNRVAAINIRRLVNLGVHHDGEGWALAAG